MNKLIFCLLLFAGCATVSVPEGGEKDTDPPVLLKSSPDSAELNFNGDEVLLEFDEYFQVQSFNAQVIVSPPFDKPLRYKVKGKKLQVTFPDSLRSNTTYQIHFGESIADVNESNILKDLKLVFSTGSYIDSSFIRGKVEISPLIPDNLENLKAILYKQYSDTNYSLSSPYYIAVVNKQQRFSFSNIQPGAYHLVILNDANANYRYEPGEYIATSFSEIQTDSAGIQVSVFKEVERKQKLDLDNSITINDQCHALIFNRRPDYIGVSAPSDSTLLLTTRSSRKGDSLFVYFNKPIPENDSVLLLVNTPDSIFRSIARHVNRTLPSPKFNIYSSVISPLDTPMVVSRYPILDTATVHIINLTDSLHLSSSIYFPSLFKMALPTKLKEGKQYRLLVVRDTSVTDTFHFQTTSSQNTSKLSFNISLTDSIPVIIRLKTQGPDAYNWYVRSDTTITGEYLRPGSYSLIAIKDINGDGAYTTGSLKERRQPEEVFTLQSSIELKADWESSGVSYTIE